MTVSVLCLYYDYSSVHGDYSGSDNISGKFETIDIEMLELPPVLERQNRTVSFKIDSRSCILFLSRTVDIGKAKKCGSNDILGNDISEGAMILKAMIF